MAVILVAYDISDDTRRLKLARALERLGYSRVQRSVYIHPRAYRGLRRRTVEVAARLMDPSTDRVLVLIMPEGVFRDAIHLGGAQTLGAGLTI